MKRAQVGLRQGGSGSQEQDKLGRQGGSGSQEQPRMEIMKGGKLGRQGGSGSQEQQRQPRTAQNGDHEGGQAWETKRQWQPNGDHEGSLGDREAGPRREIRETRVMCRLQNLSITCPPCARLVSGLAAPSNLARPVPTMCPPFLSLSARCLPPLSGWLNCCQLCVRSVVFVWPLSAHLSDLCPLLCAVV